MKKILPVLVLFSFLFLLGCTQEDSKSINNSAFVLTHPCPKLPCNDVNRFSSVLTNVFDLSGDSYSVDCAECAFPYGKVDGSYTKSRLDFNGEKVELFYKKGLCLQPGVNCGWEVCITSLSSDTKNLVENAKQKFCPMLESKLSEFSLKVPSCANEVLYDTNFIRERCLNGYYDSIDGDSLNFSVIQSETTCGLSVQKGKFNCMD
ncbi:MAG: hypothetical protein WCW44_03145 [archaeon]|jgi:hypothetical protein